MSKTLKFIQEKSFYLIYLYALAGALSNSAITVFIALFILLYLFNIKENFAKSPKGFIIFAAYYIWRFLTLLFNGIFSQFGRIINIWDKTPYLTASCIKVDKEKIINFFLILFWINSAVVIYALFEKYAGFPPIVKSLFTDDMTRFRGFFSHPLRFAGYISSVAVISFCFSVFYSKKFIKFAPILIFAVFFTGSRSYFLSVIFSTVFLSYFKSKKFFNLYALFILLYGIIIFAAFPQIRNRAASSFDKISGEQTSASLRFNFWKAGIETFSLSPIYGVGDGQLTNYLKPYKEKKLIDNVAHAHNAYITCAAESGIIGLLIYLYIFFFFMKKYFLTALKTEDSLKKAFSFSLFGVYLNLAIAGFFESNFSTLVIWSFVTFLMGLFHSYYDS
ncbi:MAG: O-antigen ligase family protein [Elusimicrobiota bacterium]